ncbi:hypothetical protein LP419_12120 [Massilia sp. H-1]|nr:hypothetical protein LP419_12120 [Massilia sp. H-1]
MDLAGTVFDHVGIASELLVETATCRRQMHQRIEPEGALQHRDERIDERVAAPCVALFVGDDQGLLVGRIAKREVG